MYRYFFLLIFLISQSIEANIINPVSQFTPIKSEGGMVVSRDRLASQVGADILNAGGNAFDAAAAVGFALAVTLPQAGNLGGGGFMVGYEAENNQTFALDYRETAPQRSYRDMFLKEDGTPDNKKSRDSIFSVGVPGTVAGLVRVQHDKGVLSLRRVMIPAIKIAEEGFIVSRSLADSFAKAQNRLSRDNAARKYFLKANGDTYKAGELWVQQDLARTLKRISKSGAREFYAGRTANQIVQTIEEHKGIMSLQDLQEYRSIYRNPIVATYRGFKVVSMPPPSSGGVHLIQMLNILENFDLSAMGHNSASYIHLLVESMRQAYADRSHHLGDSDFYPVPIKRLISKKHAKQIAAKIKPMVRKNIAPLSIPYESEETTHFSIWDKHGNVASNTYTLNFPFGSAIAVNGMGFLLNNELDDFSAKPGAANAYGLIGSFANRVQSNKRPLSSMTPTLLLHKDKPVLATGSPGGSTIITTVLQMILNVVDFEMNIAEATARSRVHHQWLPNILNIEPGVSQDTLNLLLKKGHDISYGKKVLGKTQSIMRCGKMLCAQPDYRWVDAAAIPSN